MEFRQYLSIFPRRWPIIALVTLVALIVSLAFAARGPRAYEATVRLAVSLGNDRPVGANADAPPLPPTNLAPGESLPYAYFKDYYYWLAAEYLADDLGEVIRSDAFMQDIGSYLNEDMRRALVSNVIRTRKTHRILEVTVQAADPQQAVRVADAINKVVQEHGAKYLAQLATPSGQISVLDTPTAHPATTTGSQYLDLGIRVFAGLLIGVFLALVMEYLDSTLRTVQDVERALGVPILAQIPRVAR